MPKANTPQQELERKKKIGITLKKLYASGLKKKFKGVHRSPKTEFKKGKPSPLKGKKNPKGSIAKTGKNNPMWGRKPNEKQMEGLKIGHELLKPKGEKSPMWKGGISFEPYSTDWTETLRKSIRERDHYTCQLCSKPQGDKAHCVHHIDYNKKNSNPENLITLCVSCNFKVNTNRDYWTKYF